MIMRYLMPVAMLVAVGCSASGLQNHQSSQVAHLGPQCVWHFTSPADTSDSDETTGVSSCDDTRLTIDDGIVSIAITSDGVVHSDMCASMAAKPLQPVEGGWFADVSGCGIVGFVGVNLR